MEAFLRQNNFKWDIFKEVKIRRVKHILSEKLSYIESAYDVKTSFDDPFEYEKNF